MITKTVLTNKEYLKAYYEFIGYFVVEKIYDLDTSCIELTESTLDMAYYNIFLLPNEKRLQELNKLESSYSTDFAKLYCKLSSVKKEDMKDLEKFVANFDTLACKVLLAQYKAKFSIDGFESLLNLAYEYKKYAIIYSKLLLLLGKMVKDLPSLESQALLYFKESFELNPIQETAYEIGLCYFRKQMYQLALYAFFDAKNYKKYNYDNLNTKIAECYYGMHDFLDCIEYCDKVKSKYTCNLKERCFHALGVK